MRARRKHWTAKSLKDYEYRIASDFVMQVEQTLEKHDVSQAELAEKLGVTEGRVSQIINNPGNLQLSTIVQWARVLSLKVAVVAYDDGDPENERGPVLSDVFRICWERCGRPADSWDLKGNQDFEMAVARKVVFNAEFSLNRRLTSKEEATLNKVAGTGSAKAKKENALENISLAA